MIRTVLSSFFKKLLGVRPPFVSDLDRVMHAARKKQPLTESQKAEKEKYDAVYAQRDG